MPERFEVYRYEITREGQPPETRWSFAPSHAVRYAGRGEPLEANPLAQGDGAEAAEMRPAGVIEAPDGTTLATVEPPVLDIPGRGRVDLHAVLGETEGSADNLGHLVRFRPG